MATAKPTVERLTQLLRDAAKAHHEYEEKLGERHEDWPPWYAQYMHERL
jgi:hypothetical protein